MRKFLIACMLFTAMQMSGQAPVSFKLWPNGAPVNTTPTYQEQGTAYTTIQGCAEAEIFIYPAKQPNGLCIVGCPGGAYNALTMRSEGHYLSDWLNAQGITYAVLKYRMPFGNPEVPLCDAQEAIRIMRSHAAEWGISQVGIMGFSAGGHLASTAATHYTADSRPDFQILFYPVVTMTTATHGGSRKNLLGTSPTEEQVQLYSNELHVDAQTPPAFIMHSSDDTIVPVANSVNYYMALVRNGVEASLHIFSTGGHGWGFKDNFEYKRQWTGELEKWLRIVAQRQKSGTK